MQKVYNFYFESRKFLQDSLDDLNPTRPIPEFSNNPHLVKCLALNNLFLVEEIGCRSLLLVDRCARCAYATSLCAYSILYRAVGKTPSPFDYKGYFCQEFRHLAAESFELIGVVVCSILLFPFNRNSSSPPIHNLVCAQIWIEKTAERISGERKYINFTQTARSEKSTLYEMQNIAGFDEKKREEWTDIATKFNSITQKIDQSQNRRIARNYLSEPTLSAAKNQLQTELSFLQDFVSDTTRMHAICKQQERLILLKSLIGDSSASTSIQDSASKDEKLKYFNDLTLEIEKTTAKLHTIHDPDCKVQRELESLDKNRERALLDALESLKKNQIYRLSIMYNHFYFVNKKYNEIQFMYSYQHIENPLTFEAKTFIADLLREISLCQTLLNEANRSWSLKQPQNVSLNRQRALAILGLDKGATLETIKTTYRKLALIHHPDKGGDEATFKILFGAYEYLTSSSTLL